MTFSPNSQILKSEKLSESWKFNLNDIKTTYGQFKDFKGTLSHNSSNPFKLKDNFTNLFNQKSKNMLKKLEKS